MDRATFESSFVESLDIRPPNWWVEPPLRNLMRQFARAYRLSRALQQYAEEEL
ncbi:unnamed protein product, partial [Symbiodinium microadriaticum]